MALWQHDPDIEPIWQAIAEARLKGFTPYEIALRSGHPLGAAGKLFGIPIRTEPDLPVRFDVRYHPLEQIRRED